MHRYTVGTQWGQLKGGVALGDLPAARGDWFSPPQLFTVPFRKHSGNTQWRVCLLAHTLLLCSWFWDSVHSRYTVGTQWYTVAALAGLEGGARAACADEKRIAGPCNASRVRESAA